jgi:hypothetical protein
MLREIQVLREGLRILPVKVEKHLRKVFGLPPVSLHFLRIASPLQLFDGCVASPGGKHLPQDGQRLISPHAFFGVLPRPGTPIARR